ncbi:MAG: methionyl-tRNA formyltransferase [Bacteroidales bacterium]|nr:methionyl-tRNA formyltransferase [Bacteroidales bacterium]MDD4430245.1 methionyl-tRNA formyltransferase [Bacteroidales bacterium]
MQKQELRIVYMGTPEFAAAPLQALIDNNYKVVAVISMPDKAMGRGLKTQASPVKQLAQSLSLPVLQPDNLKDPVFLEELRSYAADLQIVVAFRMLPEAVWAMPPMGTFNLHASLLPQYRGAAPIQWAVINGEKQTGLTTFLLDRQMDTGRILLQEKIAIGPDETGGSVYSRLMELSGPMVLRTLDLLLSGLSRPQDQEQFIKAAEALKAAPKLHKDNTRIDWMRPGAELYNFVRGLSPHPAAWTAWQKPDSSIQTVKVYQVAFEAQKHTLKSGLLLSDEKNYLKTSVPNGFVHWELFQPAGKKAMSASDFLRGRPGIKDFILL